MLQQLVILASQSRPNQTSKVAPPRCTSTPRHYSLPTTHPARYFCASFVFMSLQIAPLGQSIWKVFIFMILRIPFFVSALYSHLYKLPGGVPFRPLSPLPPFRLAAPFSRILHDEATITAHYPPLTFRPRMIAYE